MKAENKKSVRRLCISLVIIGLLLLAFYLIMRGLGVTSLTREQIQDYVSEKGAAGPIVFILISFLGTVLLPIPGAVTIVAGSFVFGAALSFLYSYLGMLSGAMVSFFLGRLIGKPFVNWITGGEEETKIWLSKLRGKENVVLFFMFLFPAFPDDLLCALAGILPISGLGFFFMQVVTRATSVGATLLFMSGEIIPFHGWGLAVLGAVGAVGIAAFILCFRNATKISDVFYSLIQKIAHTKPFSRKKR